MKKLLLLISLLVLSVSAPTQIKAQFTFPIGHFSSNGPALLSDTVSSVVAQLDATIEASYGGSGSTWTSVTPVPADSSATADWLVHLGLDGGGDGDEPAFNGSAGDPAAFFSSDGGDFFTFKTLANATTLANAHKQGGAYWVAFSHRVATTTSQVLWGSGNASNDIGVKGQADLNGFRRMFHFDGTSQAQNGEAAAANDYADGDDVLVIFSMDMTSDTNNIRIWTVSSTAQQVSVTRLNTTSAADGLFHIAATADSTPSVVDIMISGTRIYGFAVGNVFLDNTEAAKIYAYYETLHARDYTP